MRRPLAPSKDARLLVLALAAAACFLACQPAEGPSSRNSADTVGPAVARDAHHEKALAALLFRDGKVTPRAGVLPEGDARAHLAAVEDSLRGGRKGSALQSAVKAVVTEPENVRALERLGHVLRRLGRGEQAAIAFSTALSMDDRDVPSAAGLAWLATATGDWPEAMDLWQRVLALEPGHRDAHGRLAAAFYYGGRNRQALDHLEQAERGGKPFPGALRELLETGRPLTAEARWDGPENPEPLGASLQVGAPRRIDTGGGTAHAVETSVSVAAGASPHMVAGWNDLRAPGDGGFWSLGVGLSLDGGTTWFDSLLKPPGTGVNNHEGDPMTLFEPESGYLFVGGILFTGQRALFVSRKAPAATSFEPMVILQSDDFIDRGWMASGPVPGSPQTTRIYVAYNLGLQSSDDLGATWTPVRSLELGVAQHPRVDTAGRLFLIDWDFDVTVRMQRSFDGGVNFLAPTTAATRMDTWGPQDGSRFPGQFRVAPLAFQAMHPADGTLYAVYFDTTGVVGGNADVDLYMTESTDRGVTWTTPRTIPSALPGDQLYPWLEVDAAGRLHLLFFDSGSFTQDDDVENGRFHVNYALSLDGGDTWTVARLTDTAINSSVSDWPNMGQFLGDFVNLAVSGDRVYAVYPTTMNGDQDIVIQTIDIGQGGIFADGFESGHTGRWSATVE